MPETTPDQLPIPLPDPEPTPEPVSEFRFTDAEETPEVLRGRSASEVANIFKALTAEREPPNGNGNGHPAPPPPPPPQVPAGPTLQQIAEQQASMVYEMAKQRNAPIFQRYGAEIDGMLQRVPREHWSPEVVENAVRLTKGNHVDEIVAERMRDAEQTAYSTMRSTGRGASDGYGVAPEPKRTTVTNAPDSEWSKRAAAAGITDREVAEFCKMNDMEPGEFWRQFGSGLVTDAIADVSYKQRQP